jgi:hypothetical protein
MIKKEGPMFEPTEEMMAAYSLAKAFPTPSMIGDLADLAQHATAAALKAEHEASHVDGLCESGDCFSKSPADWLRLADEKLREVKR